MGKTVRVGIVILLLLCIIFLASCNEIGGSIVRYRYNMSGIFLILTPKRYIRTPVAQHFG